ncbi:hypothetical protein, partial [Agathobacter rectalis]|uniref:hypothetical protein n=1 Tax=Agathobacter rectalis TaxID=39491 RepID=UPI0027D231C4
RFELIKLLENQELLNECGIYFCTGIYFFKLAFPYLYFFILFLHCTPISLHSATVQGALSRETGWGMLSLVSE